LPIILVPILFGSRLLCVPWCTMFRNLGYQRCLSMQAAAGKPAMPADCIASLGDDTYKNIF
jgi:hypothetical protein